MWFWPSQQYTQAFSAARTGRCSVSSGVVFESSTLWFSWAREWAAAGHSPPLSFPAGAWPCWRISEQRCSTSPDLEQNLGKGALMWLHQSRIYSSSCTWLTLLKTTSVRCNIDTLGKKPCTLIAKDDKNISAEFSCWAQVTQRLHECWCVYCAIQFCNAFFPYF